jgi:hypothetical protein
MARSFTILIALLALVGSFLYREVKLRLTVLGFTRPQSSIKNIHGEELRIIPNTMLCEDLHYHETSGLLFTACEGDATPRGHWFPGLAHLSEPSKAGRGTINVIDPKVC